MRCAPFVVALLALSASAAPPTRTPAPEELLAQLVDAVDRKDAAAVMRLVALGAPFEKARAVLASRASPVAPEPPPQHPVELLLWAIEHDDEPAFQRLVAKGLAANGTSPNRRSAFLSACVHGRVSMVRRLLEHGATATTQAVENAVLCGHRAVFELLVSGTVESQGTKSADRDALSIARERARKLG